MALPACLAEACSFFSEQSRGMHNGEVAKRSNAADCKSVVPATSEVRILPSPAFARPSGELRLGHPLSRMAQVASRMTREGCLAEARSAKADFRRLIENEQRARRFENEALGCEMCGSNSVVESQPSKLLVAGSIPVSRSNLRSSELRASYGWRAIW